MHYRRTYGFLVSLILLYCMIPDVLMLNLSTSGIASVPGKPTIPLRVQVVSEGLNSLGASGSMTVTGTAQILLENAELRLILPEGLVKTGGENLWTGNLSPGNSKEIRVQVRIVSKGNWTIEGRLAGFHGKARIGKSDFQYISASEGKVECRSKPFLSWAAAAQKASIGKKVTQNQSSPGYLTVCGYWYFYEQYSDVIRPAKHLRVVLYDQDPLQFVQLSETVTDDTGYFQFPSIENNDGWMEDGYDIFVRIYSESSMVKVTDDSGNMYYSYTPTYDNVPDGWYDVGSWAVPSNWNGRGAFVVADTVNVGYDYAAELGYSHQKVNLYWPSDGSYTEGGNYRNIHLVSGDEFDEDVILHEYGHSVQYGVYGQWIPGSGGSHSWNQHISPNMAFSEGWPTFFGVSAGYTKGYGDYLFPKDSWYKDTIDTWISHDLESDPHEPGDDVESTVACILWDIFDSSSDGRDSLSAGISPIWDVFRYYLTGGHNIYTIHEFWDGWLARGWNYKQVMWGIYYDHGVNKDTTPPSNPSGWSGSHSTGTWSSVRTVYISWSGASDDTSGIYGYSIVWDNSPSTLPDQSVDTTSTSSTSPSLSDGTWYFHIRTRDQAGNWNSGAYHIGPFYIDATPPSTPILSESHCGSGWTTHNSPYFAWNNPGDAGGSGVSFYEGSVDEGSPFTVSSPYHPTWGDGTRTFKVRVVDGAGNRGSWSNTITVNIDTISPTIPTLASPSDGTATTNPKPTFQWSAASDSGSGVASYTLQIDTSVTFGSVNLRTITGISSTSYTPSTDLTYGTWYWRVKAVDNSGKESAFSDYWSIIIQTLPPPAPTLLSPADGATGVSLTPTLSWSAVSGPCDGYTVRVLRLVDFWTVEVVLHVDLGVVTSYSVPSGKLVAATTYIWVVWAHNGAGFSPYSSRYFSTSGSPPLAPSLVSPADGATGVSLTPTLSWSAVSGPCDGYTVSVLVASTGALILHVDLPASATSYVLPSGKLNSATTYVWVVWAHNGAGWSPYSTRVFTTA